MFEYMDRRQLLQTPEEQSRLLREVPNVFAEEVEPETVQQDDKHEKDSSQMSTVRETLEIPSNPASDGKLSTLLPLKPGNGPYINFCHLFPQNCP